MGKTDKQKAADAALDRAVTRVFAAYEMLPPDYTVVDVIEAMCELTSGMMAGAIASIKEELDGQAQEGPQSWPIRQ